MRIPIRQAIAVKWYQLKNLILGKKGPVTLTLEPILQDNRIYNDQDGIRPTDPILRRRLSVSQCITAAIECPAPIISISGGEPLLHHQIGDIIQSLLSMGKFVYLHTNGLLLERRITDKIIIPHANLCVSICLNGIGNGHDTVSGVSGDFLKVKNAIFFTIKKGFRVTIDAMISSKKTAQEITDLLTYASRFEIEGIHISARKCYTDKPDQSNVASKTKGQKLLNKVFETNKKTGIYATWKIIDDPRYLSFMTGNDTSRFQDDPSFGVLGWHLLGRDNIERYAVSYLQLNQELETLITNPDFQRAEKITDRRIQP